jgi:hypothetical protein
MKPGRGLVPGSSPPGLAGPAAHETLLLRGRVVGTEVGILVQSEQVSFLLVLHRALPDLLRIKLRPYVTVSIQLEDETDDNGGPISQITIQK